MSGLEESLENLSYNDKRLIEILRRLNFREQTIISIINIGEACSNKILTLDEYAKRIKEVVGTEFEYLYSEGYVDA